MFAFGYEGRVDGVLLFRSRVLLLVAGVVAILAGLAVAPVAANATSVETSAVNWAVGQIGSTAYDGLCLTLVTDAYQTGAGFNIESLTNYGSFNSSTYPQEVWDAGFNAGTTGGASTTPPYGALVFYNASGPGASDPAEYSHVTIMGSNGEMISSPDVVNETKVHDETMAQVAAAHPYNTYVGWWLPDGTNSAPPPTITTFSASPTPVNSSGGGLALEVSAQNAQSYTFTSPNPGIAGLTTVTTSGGTAQDDVSLPVNRGSSEVTFTFEVSVSSPGGTVTAQTTVEELGGDFTGTGKAQVLFYAPGDQDWYLGSFSKAGSLSWSQADDSSGFGDTAQDPTWIGNF